MVDTVHHVRQSTSGNCVDIDAVPAALPFSGGNDFADNHSLLLHHAFSLGFHDVTIMIISYINQDETNKIFIVALSTAFNCDKNIPENLTFALISFCPSNRDMVQVAPDKLNVPFSDLSSVVNATLRQLYSAHYPMRSRKA
jgi:hypothetical protein